MIKLNSFSELEIPASLYPSDVAFYLEDIVSRSVNYLAGLSLEEVNQSLFFIRHYMRETRHMGDYNGISDMMKSDFKTLIKRKLNGNNKFAPPDEEIGNDILIMQMLDRTFFDNKEKFLRDDVNGNETVENVLEIHKKIFGSMSLYYYILGLNIARREKRKNTSENNKHYRLGKSSPYFFASNFILNLLSQMQSEVSAITQKEKQVKEKNKGDC